MNRMIGVGEDCTSSITERSRCSNSPFIEAPACMRPTSSTHSLTPRSGGGTSPDGDALREALDDRRLADAGLAGEDRIVLATAHQHVDDLPDFLVAAENRVHVARLGLGGEILAEAIERGRALWRRARRSFPPRSAAASPEPSIGRRLPSSDSAQIERWLAASSSTGILANSCDTSSSARLSSSDFSIATSRWPVRICVSPNSSVA